MLRLSIFMLDRPVKMILSGQVEMFANGELTTITATDFYMSFDPTESLALYAETIS